MLSLRSTTCSLLLLAIVWTVSPLPAKAQIAEPIEFGKKFTTTETIQGKVYTISITIPESNSSTLLPKVTMVRENDSAIVHLNIDGEILAARTILTNDEKTPTVLHVHGFFVLRSSTGREAARKKIEGVLYSTVGGKLSFRGTGFKSVMEKFELLSRLQAEAPAKAEVAAPVEPDPCTEDPDDMNFSVQ